MYKSNLKQKRRLCSCTGSQKECIFADRSEERTFCQMCPLMGCGSATEVKPAFCFWEQGLCLAGQSAHMAKNGKDTKEKCFMGQGHCLYFKWKQPEGSQHYTFNEWVLVFQLPSKVLIFDHGKIDTHGFDAALFTLWAVKQKMSGKIKRAK